MHKTSTWFGQQSARVVGVLLTCLLAFLASSQSVNNQWFDRFELLYYDWRFSAVPLHPNEPNDALEHRIVIVDVDEASLTAVGQWPWKRSVLATLVKQLAAQGAVVVGFDVVFAEPETGLLQGLAANTAEMDVADVVRVALRDAGIALETLDGDAQLASAMGETDVVLGVFFQPDQTLQSGQLLASVAQLDSDRKTGYIQMPGYSSAIAPLMSSAVSGGFVSTFGDADGIIRRSPLVIRYQDALNPFFNLTIQHFSRRNIRKAAFRP